MYQIDNSTAATTQPASTAAGTAGFFTDGNPATSTPATIVPAEWLNAVMMELANVVTGAGLTLAKNQFNQVLSAIKRLGQTTIVLTDTGSANAYTATNATPLVAGTWVDGVIQQIKIAHANTGASTYAPDGLPAIPIYGLGLQPLQGGELALNGTAVLMHATIAGINSGNPICVLMECAGGAQPVAPATASQHAVQFGQVRKLLTANLTIYVATTGNDSTGNGTSGNPFATIQKAYNYIQQTYDLNGFIATIQVANGTYTAGLTAGGPLVGALGVTNCVVQGNTASPSSVVINVGNSTNCFAATRGGQITVQGFTVQGGTASQGFATNDNLSQINLGAGIVFGSMPSGAHINANSGTINANSSYSITGGASVHAIASNPGSIVTISGGIKVTLTGTPAFSTSFVNAGYLGMVTASSVTFSGAATGALYGVSVNGVVNSGGAGANYFPGSTAGATATGGQYI
ncbi:hypothetical protein M3795_16945 [Ralstonia pickettii]|uniref:Uncharacterized protein n=1 Tax=Ralstonia pickettii OR214 TaxID=1264675 RepID=R0E1X9_RALPI|nr:hypothetical protein [Ralstonia pickettii]ENZ79638.1 hypothetical protein OR214_00055 [Ralstonia pickettii OR214]MCM3582172.1 hypothetical protein [Ralstonia pickettii]